MRPDYPVAEARDGDIRAGSGTTMDVTTGLIMLMAAAGVGAVATLAMLRRQRLQAAGPHESPYATSTEGMKRCPACNTGNLVTDANCSNCGKHLPG